MADIRTFATEHLTEAQELLRTLGQIPAPSHGEGRRAEFILGWLRENGAPEAYIDPAGNVLFPWQCRESGPLSVIAAHTDIVFPDTEPLPMREEGGRLYAPGIGDDTANVVCMLMAVKYLLSHPDIPGHGLLFAADACEEGLGNLAGVRRIFSDWGTRAARFVSFDLDTGFFTDTAVGSERFSVTVKAPGGHSFNDFGSASAIAQAAVLISDLYAQEVPEAAKTTFNVGTIEGGTTVNAIAERCTFLYEFRSEDRACLARMEEQFRDILEKHRAGGVVIETETLGIRPCKGDVPEAAQARLTDMALGILNGYHTVPVVPQPGSTDANIPLSMGIPAVTFGTCVSGGAHTRGEWAELASLREGIEIAVRTVLALAEQ